MSELWKTHTEIKAKIREGQYKLIGAGVRFQVRSDVIDGEVLISLDLDKLSDELLTVTEADLRQCADPE